jgi:hypothetical protein
MADVKLAPGMGAWIGAGRRFLALVVTGILGGLLGWDYGFRRSCPDECLDDTSDLLAHFAKRHWRPRYQIRLENTGDTSITYVPTVATGTILIAQ